MTELIVILFAASMVIFITFYAILRRNIINISNQLNEINVTKTNSKLLISSSDKQLRKLVLAINKSLDEKKKTESEYKRMELELRQAIANISHDLRTPLTSIMGYMQLIEANNLSDDEKKEYIDIVKKRSQSLQILISSFYDLSRLEAKEYKFELKSLNISNLVCDIMASFYKDFLDKGIEPTINIDEKVIAVIADENAVRRVVFNLVQNMLRYGKGLISISLTQHKGYVSTIFSNDAPDLSEEDVSHLFERFFTADRTRTGKSTGLGLAITKQLVEQMGHIISAKQLDGKLFIEIKWKN
jgi:signal transduction histidine kinase